MQEASAFLVSPYNQLLVFTVILVVAFILSLANAPTVIKTGYCASLVWLVAASFVGVGSSYSWFYYAHLIVALLVGYVLFIGLSWAADKWGTDYNSEGVMVVLVPFFLSPFVLVPAVILKLLNSAFKNIIQ